jgi:hypothetical protein
MVDFVAAQQKRCPIAESNGFCKLFGRMPKLAELLPRAGGRSRSTNLIPDLQQRGLAAAASSRFMMEAGETG